MRDYAQISPRFWTGKTGKALRGHPEAQVIAFYLMSSPGSHMIGMYPLELPTLCHHTGLSLEGAIKGLARLAGLDFAYFDDVAELVWVPEMAHFQIAPSLKRGDNRVTGVEKELDNYKNSKFYGRFLDRYRIPFNLRMERNEVSPLEPAPEGAGKGLSSQEQEQEQDQEQIRNKKKTSAPEVAARPPAAGDKGDEVGPTVPIRNAYEVAYKTRYGVEPIRNKTVNGVLSQFLARVGAEEAPRVAEFYVSHNGPLYVRAGHPVQLLLRDAEKLRTEWKTGKPMPDPPPNGSGGGRKPFVPLTKTRERFEGLDDGDPLGLNLQPKPKEPPRG